MDPMSGWNIRLVFTLPPRDSTLQNKRCVHFWNNFPCIFNLGYRELYSTHTDYTRENGTVHQMKQSLLGKFSWWASFILERRSNYACVISILSHSHLCLCTSNLFASAELFCLRKTFLRQCFLFCVRSKMYARHSNRCTCPSNLCVN